MTEKWDELCMAEDLAYFKGNMVLDSPESFTVEEMWKVVMEMFETTIAVQEAMHEDFMRHTPEECQALLDTCVGSGTAQRGVVEEHPPWLRGDAGLSRADYWRDGDTRWYVVT